ncbi:MAG: DUF4381 domain-containing protein [Halieaceae bacterium]
MSAPPLPETFGNYALGDFVEVVSPTGISWLPQTIGWWFIAGILIVYLSRWAWRHLVHWYRNRYRKEALARLSRIPPSDSYLAELSKLLKITAVTAYNRPETAQLAGAPWPAFLNQKCDTKPFDEELSTLLAEGVYREVMLSEVQRDRLLAAARIWVKSHRENEHLA